MHISKKHTVIASTILLFCSMGIAWASGLEEPEALAPVVSPTQPCNLSIVNKEKDFDRALFHYTVAVGQETQTAQLSASKMVRSHQTARLQTCDIKAKAVTDGFGSLVRDGLLQIVIN